MEPLRPELTPSPQGPTTAMKRAYHQAVSAGLMAPRRAFQDRLEAQLAVWNAKLAYMQYQAITAPGA